jgi:hypothetical protein
MRQHLALKVFRGFLRPIFSKRGLKRTSRKKAAALSGDRFVFIGLLLLAGENGVEHVGGDHDGTDFAQIYC